MFLGVHHPDATLAINVDAVRPTEMALAPTGEKDAVGLQHNHRVVAATEDVDPVLRVAGHVHHPARRAQARELKVGRYLGPVVHALVLVLTLS